MEDFSEKIKKARNLVTRPKNEIVVLPLLS